MADISKLTLALAGFGTVGSGLLRILADNKEEILSRTGCDIRVRGVLVRDASRPRACPLPEGAYLTTNMEDLLEDPEVDVVVELIGGTDKAGQLVERALKAGKHVVTANKALLAESGNTYFALAQEKGLHLAYEASVCGGIPIVQTLRESLAANRIESLEGILNGTSNYVLSEMTSGGMSFADALGKAQELGYAEADPTLDIGGGDAAHKLALLIRLAWGVEYPFKDLPVRGIENVRAEDIRYAREFGYRIKLLGHARLVGESLGTGAGIEAHVAPALVHESLLLAKVGGAFNAVRIEGDAIGSVFLHGKGAGDMPTGSSVAADILAIARKASPNNTGFARPALPCPARVIPQQEAISPYYIRLSVSDAPGVLRNVAGTLADNNISIAQVIQKDSSSQPPSEHAGSREPCVPLIVMTHEAAAAGVDKALQHLAHSPFVHEPPVYYRVLARRSVGL
jgi:Homoserine dehydrogenase